MRYPDVATPLIATSLLTLDVKVQKHNLISPTILQTYQKKILKYCLHGKHRLFQIPPRANSADYILQVLTKS